MKYQVWMSSLALLCISILLSYYFVRYEHFIGSMNAQMCGVDKPPCPFGTTCANGYCMDGNPPLLPENTGLPVLP
jgi:hypothetical protein